LRAQEILAEKYGVSADVWSATNYKQMRNDAISCQRWNMLHPTETQRKSYVETLLAKEKGAFVAVSDNMRIVADQIAPWFRAAYSRSHGWFRSQRNSRKPASLL